MAKRRRKEEEAVVPEEVVAEGNEVIINGEKFQRPDPVIPQEDAVAKDAPVYENLPEIE